MVTQPDKYRIKRIRSELLEGMNLVKCRKCGCMRETLESLRSSLPSLQTADYSDLLKKIEGWLKRMKPIEYACLGCDHCYPAVATNVVNSAYGGTAQLQSPTCTFEMKDQSWPPVPGEYFTFCEGASCPVAVSTLASVELAERIASIRPKELCIIGKTETENIGVDKIVKNTISNPTIRFLLLAGKDSKGHHSGKTLLALSQNGVDERMRVIGSPGKRPVLRNVTSDEVGAFRKQVEVVDMIGCEEAEKITKKIASLSNKPSPSCICEEQVKQTKSDQISTMPIVQAKSPIKAEMDKAGYFVILPQPAKSIIIVEHYSYDNKLLRVIEGKDAKSIYGIIIENSWITQLNHAAYLGTELAKAELSIKMGFKYVQDGA